MKKFYMVLLFCICVLCNACNPNESKEDDLLLDVKGVWELYDNLENCGVLLFNDYESFVLEIKDKPVVFADITVLPSKSPIITISYAEDEDGNEFEHDGVWTCEIHTLTTNKAEISNLPYYENKKLSMIRK